MTKKLPEKLHQIVRIAIDDVKACENDPNYVLDMDAWHHKPTNDGPCLVCMAGAVMAKTLGANEWGHCLPEHFGPEAENALQAIDALRDSELKSAFDWMGIEEPEDTESFPSPLPHPTAFGFEFDDFIASWERSLKWLEERNL